MPGVGTLLVFASVSLVLVATPGPGLLYLIGRTVEEGRRAGLASMLGVETAELAYLACAAVGLTALIAHSSLAFTGIRYFGAVYLVGRGVVSWLRVDRYEEPLPVRFRHAFAQGVVTQLLNPKVAIFFLAYFPQFVRPNHPVVPQLLVLGVIYLLVALTSDSVYVLLASSLVSRIGRSSRANKRLSRLSALIYVGLGLAAALFGARDTARALSRLRTA